jgi:hypothetical protein
MKICVVIPISPHFNVNWCGVVEALVLELTPSLVMIDYDDTRIQLSPIASRVADLSQFTNFRKKN